jgi:ABC-type amino acid transport substrate-binding protein
MKKNILFFVILLPFLFVGKVFGEEQENKKLDPFIIGTTSGYAPYVSLNAKGDYEGFDIDVAEQIANKLGKKLVIKDCGSMPGLMLALKQNKVDALIWAISITEERMKNLEMVYYHGEKITEMPFLFWNKIPEGIKSIEDLGNDPKKVVCVEAGTSQEDVLKKFSKIQLKFIDKITDVIMEIKYGKSFTTSVDPSLLPRFKAKYPEIKVLYLPLPQSEHVLGCGVCLNKSNTKLTPIMRQITQELIDEGKIAELEKKWNMNPSNG